MKENKMPCSIIVDMMSLYNDGVCSEESRNMVDEHISSCEKCRKLCEKTITAPVENVVTPDEAETFKKVNSRIKFGKIKFYVLLFVFIFLTLSVVYLSIGQIVKDRGPSRFKSFDTLFQSLEVKQIAKSLAEGDIDKFASKISSEELVILTDDLSLSRKIHEAEKEALKNAYNNEFYGTSAKHIDVKSMYTEVDLCEEAVVYSEADIYFENGKSIKIDFIKCKDGLYQPIVSKETGNEFYECIDNMSMHSMYFNWFIEKVLVRNCDLTEESVKFVSGRFAPEYRETVEKHLLDFYKKGYEVTFCDTSSINFDEERKLRYYYMTIKAKDDKGEALLHVKIYRENGGLILPDKDMYEVFSDNCSEQLVKELGNFFG